MAVLILERVKIVRFFCGVFLVLMIIWGISRWPEAGRSLYGVKDRVTLEGLSVERLLPHELRALVEELAKRRTLPPENAGFFPETGELIPEKAGLGVDVESTVENVLRAQPGEALSLVTYSIPAAVTRDFFTPVFKGDTSGKKASITVNVAWGEEEIPALLAILREHGVKATFFFVGDWVRKFPDLVREIRREGHEIANHGLYHGHPAKMSRTELHRLIMENARLLDEVTGEPPAKLFAPPYGEFNSEVLAVAGNLGYRTILWTVDTVDWKRPAPEVIIQRVTGKIEPGAIILMHPTAPTVAALGTIIENLKAQGYTLLPVGQLLREG
ncbi:MAG: polysaccharide deacetylase family protein [Clostridia bacterium]|nr:polysaccharide deacetylase family protein [Clostridia bacterium]